MSQADLSLLNFVPICASSLLLWVIWVIWGSFLCYLHLSAFRVGNHLHLFGFPVGSIFGFWGDLHWGCISHLWGLSSFCSLLCTHLCVCCVEIHIYSGTSTLFWWGDHQTLHWPIFISSPSPPSFAAPFNVFLPISTTCCLPTHYLISAYILCKHHWAVINFAVHFWRNLCVRATRPSVPEHQFFEFAFFVDLIWLYQSEIKGMGFGVWERLESCGDLGLGYGTL